MKNKVTSRRRYLFFRSEEHTSELQSRENLVCRLPRSSLFPYTTLFRSSIEAWDDKEAEVLGIGWAKKVKTRPSWVDVESYGSMSVLDYNINKAKKKRGDEE